MIFDDPPSSRQLLSAFAMILAPKATIRRILIRWETSNLAIIATGALQGALYGLLCLTVTAILLCSIGCGNNPRTRKGDARIARAVALALVDYTSGGKLLFSEDGKSTESGCSWRVRVSNLLGPPRDSPVPALQESWDSAANRLVAADPRVGADMHDTDMFATTFLVRGNDTAFEKSGGSINWSEFPPDLIVLIWSKQNAVHWMQPGDIALTELAGVARDQWWCTGKGAVLFNSIAARPQTRCVI